jgi:hypothetical protein
MFVARTTGFQALRNILPLIACRGSLVNNTSTANSETPAPEVLLDA